MAGPPTQSTMASPMQQSLQQLAAAGRGAPPPALPSTMGRGGRGGPRHPGYPGGGLGALGQGVGIGLKELGDAFRDETNRRERQQLMKDEYGYRMREQEDRQEEQRNEFSWRTALDAVSRQLPMINDEIKANTSFWGQQYEQANNWLQDPMAPRPDWFQKMSAGEQVEYVKSQGNAFAYFSSGPARDAYVKWEQQEQAAIMKQQAASLPSAPGSYFEPPWRALPGGEAPDIQESLEARTTDMPEGQEDLAEEVSLIPSAAMVGEGYARGLPLANWHIANIGAQTAFASTMMSTLIDVEKAELNKNKYEAIRGVMKEGQSLRAIQAREGQLYKSLMTSVGYSGFKQDEQGAWIPDTQSTLDVQQSFLRNLTSEFEKDWNEDPRLIVRRSIQTTLRETPVREWVGLMDDLPRSEVPDTLGQMFWEDPEASQTRMDQIGMPPVVSMAVAGVMEDLLHVLSETQPNPQERTFYHKDYAEDGFLWIGDADEAAQFEKLGKVVAEATRYVNEVQGKAVDFGGAQWSLTMATTYARAQALMEAADLASSQEFLSLTEALSEFTGPATQQLDLLDRLLNSVKRDGPMPVDRWSEVRNMIRALNEVSAQGAAPAGGTQPTPTAETPGDLHQQELIRQSRGRGHIGERLVPGSRAVPPQTAPPPMTGEEYKAMSRSFRDALRRGEKEEE